MSVLAENIGIPDTLYLKFGKNLKVGDKYKLAVKILEEQNFNCESFRVGYDQVLNCQTLVSNKETYQALLLNNNTNLPIEYNAISFPSVLRILMGIEGEAITDFNIEVLD
jgi:hypothetical protein